MTLLYDPTKSLQDIHQEAIEIMRVPALQWQVHRARGSTGVVGSTLDIPIQPPTGRFSGFKELLAVGFQLHLIISRAIIAPNKGSK